MTSQDESPQMHTFVVNDTSQSNDIFSQSPRELQTYIENEEVIELPRTQSMHHSAPNSSFADTSTRAEHSENNHAGQGRIDLNMNDGNIAGSASTLTQGTIRVDGGNTTVYFGNVYGDVGHRRRRDFLLSDELSTGPSHPSQSPKKGWNALFAALPKIQPLKPETTRAAFRRSRQPFGASKVLAAIPMMRVPYVDSSRFDESSRHALRQISEMTQFLDEAFATLFYAKVIPDKDTLKFLDTIRDAIQARQGEQNKYNGALGEYLDRVCRQKLDKAPKVDASFTNPDSGDDALAYLQDGLESPYWDFLTQIFIENCRRKENDNDAIEIFWRVVNDVKENICLMLDQIPWDEATSPVKHGVLRRIDVLKKFLEEIGTIRTSLQSSNVIHRAAISSTQRALAAATVEAPQDYIVEPTQDSILLTEFEEVSVCFFFLIALASALVMAFIGFYKYQRDPTAVGSFKEAGFFWQLSNFSLALVGSGYALLPLFKTARKSSWAQKLKIFVILAAIVCGIISLATFASLNKAWTSILGFFNTFFSIVSILVRERSRKEKVD